MELKPIQIGNFSFRFNPYEFKTYLSSKLCEYNLPFSDYSLTVDNKNVSETIIAKGEFFGNNAYDDFKRLYNLFMQKKSQVLIHPLYSPCYVYFKNLQLLQAPLENYIKYQFELVKIGDLDLKDELLKNTTNKYYVKSGETLFDISAKTGVDIDTIYEKNDITDPFNLTEGEIIIIE